MSVNRGEEIKDKNRALELVDTLKGIPSDVYALQSILKYLINEKKEIEDISK